MKNKLKLELDEKFDRAMNEIYNLRQELGLISMPVTTLNCYNRIVRCQNCAHGITGKITVFMSNINAGHLTSAKSFEHTCCSITEDYSLREGKCRDFILKSDKKLNE